MGEEKEGGYHQHQFSNSPEQSGTPQRQDRPEGKHDESTHAQLTTKRHSLFLEAIADQKLYRAATHLLRLENQELRQENEVFSEKIESRRRQARESAARKRAEDREAYNAYMRDLRASKKQQSE